MSRPIDEKIVAMKMDNSDFKNKVKDTLLSFGEMNKGISSASNVDFSGVLNSIDNIEKRFSLTGIAAGTIVAKLTSSAMDMVGKIGGALNKVAEGGKSRALNIEQARFQFEGLGMDVEKTMASALEAVKGTAFGLDEAAVVASQFGATGMRAGEEMTSALRGISGVAAMTGSSYSDIGNIFTTVAGNGRLMGSELLRLSSRGVNAAATLAKSMGITEQEVRSMVSKGQISFEMFAESMNDAFGEHATKANETYAGSLSNVNAALSRIGAAIHAPEFENKKDIFNALTPKIDDLFEAITPLIEAWTQFRRMGAEHLIDFINKISFDKFVELGGITNLVQAFWNVVNSGKTILGAFTTAIGNLIPNTGGNGISGVLVMITSGILKLTEGFKLGTSAVSILVNLIGGVGSIFSGLVGIVIRLGKAFANLFPKTSGGGIVGTISDIIEYFNKLSSTFANSVKEGNILTKMIDGLGVALGVVGLVLANFGNSVSEVFNILAKGDFTGKGIWNEDSKFVDILFRIREALLGVGEAWSILTKGDFTGKGPWSEDSKAVDYIFRIREALESMVNYVKGLSLAPLGDAFMTVFGVISSGVTWVIDGFKRLGSAIKEHMPSGNSLFAGGFAVGMLAIVGLVFKKVWDLVNAFKSFGDIGESLGGMVDGVTGVLEEVGGALKAFALEVKSKALINIAIAVGILAASLLILSGLDGGQIARGLTAIIGSLSALVLAMAIMTKYDITGSGFRAVVQIVALSVAFTILSGALRKISDLSWGEILKGITGLAGVMLTFTGAMALMSRVGGANVAASTGQIIALALSMNVMFSVIKKMSELDTKSLIKGTATLGVVLLELALFMSLASRSEFGASNALGIIGIAAAVLLIVRSIRSLGEMDIGTLKVGVTTLGIILGIIALFSTMTTTAGLLSTAAGLVLLSLALGMMLVPIVILGKMKLSTLAKGLIAMGAALAIVGVTSGMMTGLIPAAAGLMLMALALNMFIIPIGTLGSMKLSTLAKGILAIAAAILVIGGAAALLGLAAVPLLLGAAGLLALGIAAMTVGAGLALAGVGIALFSTSLVTLAAMTGTAVITIVSMLGTLIAGLVSLIPIATEFVAKLILGFVTALNKHVPQITHQFALFLTSMVKVMNTHIPTFSAEFTKLLVAMMDAMGEHIPTIIDSFQNMIIDIVEGMAIAVAVNGPRLTAAFMQLMAEIAIVMIDAGLLVIDALFGWIPGVTEATKAIGIAAEVTIRENFDAQKIGNDKGGDFANSLEGTSGKANTAGAKVGGSAEDGADSANFKPIGTGHGEDYSGGISGTSDSARRSGVVIAESGKSGAGSLSLGIEGENFTKGFAIGMNTPRVMSTVISAGKSIARAAKEAVNSWLDMRSPSKLMEKDGGFFSEGFAIGISKMTGTVVSSAKTMAMKARESANELMSNIVPTLDARLNVDVVMGGYDNLNIAPMSVPLNLKPDSSFANNLMNVASIDRRQNGNNNSEDVETRRTDNTKEIDDSNNRRPAVIQLVTPDRREVAKWVVDDVTDFQELRLDRLERF